MAHSKQLIIIFNIIMTVLVTVVLVPFHATEQDMIISQYYSPDSMSRVKFSLIDLDLSATTYLNYGNFGLTKNCNVISLDKHADYEIHYPGFKNSGNLGAFAELKRKNPFLNVLLSVGGIQHSKYFSPCSEKKSTRMEIIRSITKFLKLYTIDGVDIDWEFPTNPVNGHHDDYINFLQLLKETRNHFEKHFSQKKIITITGSIEKKIVEKMENVMHELVDVIDYVNLMTFEYGGRWISKKATLNAPLFYEGDAEFEELNINYTIDLYKKMGLPTNKMILGLAAYGRGWTGTDGLNKEASGEIEGTVEKGVISYTEIVDRYLSNSNYKKYISGGVPYLYNKSERTLISYDDKESSTLKTKSAMEKGLAGVFLFEANDDRKNELIQTVAHIVSRRKHHKALREDM